MSRKAKSSPPPTAVRDLLARAYLDILARDEGARMKPMLRGTAAPDQEIEQLLDELDGGSADDTGTVLRPDLAAVAILVARAIEAEPGLARRLRREAPIVTLATHTPDLVAMAKDILTRCAFPTDMRILGPDSSVQSARRDASVLVIARDGTDKDDRPEKGNGVVSAAVHRRLPVLGVAPDPLRHLPRSLLRTAEHKLAFKPLDEGALALVIEAVAGAAPTTSIDADLVRLLDIDDLPLGIRSHRTADQCIEALDEIVRKKGEYLGTGPSLEELEGYGSAKDWGLELARDLADFKTGRLAWEELDHKGLLLSGAPGVGKTQFARALAKTARVPLVATSVAQWNAASYLSGTLQAIRDAFAQARRQAPSILFIDEIDGISDRARLRGDYVEYWSQIVNLLLELLSDVDQRPGVVVIAATNHPDKIDPAIKRAGRLDREIAIEKPGVQDLERIFRFHVGPGHLVGADLMQVALATQGCTGADAEAIVRRAKGAARRARRSLAIEDLLAEARAGRPPITPEHRRRIAIHEAGHAIVGRELQAGALLGASLHDRGGTVEIESDLGDATTLPRLQDQMTLFLAGRAAERLLLKDVSIGAGMARGSDLGLATNIAYLIELRCGLGHFGNIYVDQSCDPTLIPGLLPIVRAHLDAAEKRASAILTRRKRALQSVSEMLEQRGYLSGGEIERIISDSARLASSTADTAQIVDLHSGKSA